MSSNTIDAVLLAKMFLAGAQNLDARKDWINELNVFPVPDGDTGTNMTMTIMSAVKEVQALDDPSIKNLAKAISNGSLRGARGNSGVILSQLFRGFAKVIKGADEIDIPMIAEACQKAVETAYKAVIKPKEGTILTVARGISEVAAKLVEGQMNMEDYLRSVIEYGSQVLARTPEMLPVLKEAGVVDSGGQGLIVILEGAYEAFMGREPARASAGEAAAEETEERTAAGEEIRFGYCAEFIIHPAYTLPEAQIDELRAFLLSSGESVVLVTDGETVRVHAHTDDPGAAISRALAYGPLSDIKVDNLRLAHHETLIHDAERLAKEQQEAMAENRTEPPKPVGFIAVSAGEGFREIFAGLGVDRVIEGGQTMNPSTEDVLNAIDQVNAENIFLFPNNKNIIMAANQARELVKEKNVIVIPAVTVPQGIAALISYDPGLPVIENREAMQAALDTVRTCELTYAIRDTHIGDAEIHQGDIMAVGDNGILAVGKEIHETALDGIRAMMTEDAALISIYFGEGYSEENANRLAQAAGELYPDCDVEVNEGGQPVYYCIISVE